MSREIKRVAPDFVWPLDKVWEGYLMPERLRGAPCPDCENGYSKYAHHLHNLWYGYARFRPEDNGSTPFTPGTPQIRDRAERNVASEPSYYGGGEAAIEREARRLAAHFNNGMLHHLNGDDVEALLKAGRLHDFTHTWTKDSGWVKKDPPVVPTAAEVNEWSLTGFGHDGINADVVIKARCERENKPLTCGTCDGHGRVEVYPGQRAEAEAWQHTEPPAGDGWQFWETVSEGSPQSPVFPTAQALAAWLVEHKGYRLSAAMRLIADGHSMGTFVGLGGKLYDSAEDADILAGDVPDGVEVTVERLPLNAIEQGS